MQKPTIVLFILFLLNLPLNAQNEFMYNWHFGDGAAVNFSSGSPVALPGSAMRTSEGCVSYSDDDGNLLFYSNGGDDATTFDGGVWNRNHELMPNGDIGLSLGGGSAIQSSLVIPRDGTSEYYLFTMSHSSNPGDGFKYSIVDMSLDGGLGDLSLMGVELLNGVTHDLTETFSGTGHANGTDYWLAVKGEADTMFMFQVTPSTVLGPFIQTADTGNGQMKFSVQGDKLVCGITLFDFDKSNGNISNPINLGVPCRGAAFSVSGRYLYCSDWLNGIYQFDLQAADIPNSSVLVLSTFILPLQLQIGPDFKIYFPGSSTTSGFLSVINAPELPGLACDIVENHVPLAPGDLHFFGMPHFVDSDLTPNEFIGLNGLEMNLTLHPNPASDVIYLDTDATIESIRVVSIEGVEVKDWSLTSNAVNIQSLSPGIYYLLVNGQNYRFVKF